MSQRFETLDRLRLEIADDWPGPVNLVGNPSGERLNAGWRSTPETLDVGLAQIAAGTADGRPHFVLETFAEQPYTPGTLTYQSRPVAFGEPNDDRGHVLARFHVVHLVPGDSARFRVLYRAAETGPVLFATPWVVANSTGPSPVLLFDNAATGIAGVSGQQIVHFLSVEVEVEIPAVDEERTAREISIRDVTLAAGPIDALVDDDDQPLPTVVAEPPWINVLGPSLNVRIERHPLDASTLTARIRDSALDPAQVPLVRRGRRVRARALTLDGTWSSLLDGRIIDGQATYDPAVINPDLQVAVTLVAGDANSELAALSVDEVPVAFTDLSWLLRDTGIPFTTGYGDSNFPQTPVNPSGALVWLEGSMVDHLILVRDTYAGWIWVDRKGIVRAVLDDLAFREVAAVFDESFYNARGPVVGYKLTDCVNEVTFTVIDLDGIESTFGPFSDEVSRRDFGRQAVPIRVLDQGLDEAGYAALAADIFARNGTPEQRVTECSAAVVDTADFGEAGPVFRDLYDRVDVVSGALGLTDQSVVTDLVHDIAPGRWLVTFGLSEAGSRPLPTTAVSV